ncbi:hypothetical protein CPC08DRAFT_730812 [Agrocybe pediades]|nr:hypothetical protein CPC08DRAFT_730812 [Agrocybe pediades]
MDPSKPFTSDRLASFAGYMLPPTVVDAMLFFLPRFTLSSYRIVEHLQRSWELWSPNSSRLTFYPGAQKFGTRFAKSLPTSMRRYDGHEGRFDPTISPQHFDKERPWLGFIQTTTDVSRPEFNAFSSVWIKDRANFTGKFDTSFVLQLARRVQGLSESVSSRGRLSTIRPDLWEKRPLIPNKDDVAHLNLLSKWEEAVDYYAELQREIKYMAAWCSMADALISYSLEHLEMGKIVPANETFMGVWLNGSEEDDGKWLLASRVPCFIIHELTATETRDWVASNRRLKDFHTGTNVVRLRVAANPLDQFARKNGNGLRELEAEIGLANASDHKYLPTDRERSAVNAQGWQNGVYCDPRRIVVVKEVPSTTTKLATMKDLPPPPVTGVNEKGGWDKWVEEEIDDEEYVLLKKGRKYAVPAYTYEYYDRINNRRIYLNSPIAMPPYYKANPWIFGLPAPSLRCVELEGHTQYRNRPLTTWVYFAPKPDDKEVGRCYSLECPEDQYDGRLLLGFEPSSDEEMECQCDSKMDDDDDTDHVSIPDDEDGQGLYSSLTTKSTNQVEETTNRVPSTTNLVRPPSPTRGSNSFSKKARFARSGSPHWRSPSPRLNSSRLQTPSPDYPSPNASRPHDQHKRPPPIAPTRTSNHYAVTRYFSTSRLYGRARSPHRSYRKDAQRSPSPYQPSHRRATALKSSNSYDSRGYSFRSEEGSSRNPQLSWADRHWSPTRLPSPHRSLSPAPNLATTPPKNLEIAHSAHDPSKTLLPQKRGRSSSPNRNTSPPRPSLLDRLSLPSTTAVVPYDAQIAVTPQEAQLAVVPYDAQLALQNPGSLAAPQAPHLALNFPIPANPLVPVLRTINEEGLSRFLIIWNLPVYHLWENAVAWIETVLPLVPSVKLQRVIRSNEGGQQVFWLAFQSPDQASTFRGQVAGRLTEGGTEIACDFVSPELYCSATGSQPPFWSPKAGYSKGLTAKTLLTEGEVIRAPSRTLAEMLGLQLEPTELWTHRKSRRSRRKKQDPADGGAL